MLRIVGERECARKIRSTYNVMVCTVQDRKIALLSSLGGLTALANHGCTCMCVLYGLVRWGQFPFSSFFSYCKCAIHVSLLVRVWALDVWGKLVPSKIFNLPFPVLKAGHSVSYSYICDVCLEWVNGVGFFYSSLKFLFS